MTRAISSAFSQLLPWDFPSPERSPRFNLGDRVEWKPSPHRDFGTIIGLQYAPAAHRQAWSWQYLVFLDPDSPSQGWVPSDFAWEDDLISLIPSPAVADLKESQT